MESLLDKDEQELRILSGTVCSVCCVVLDLARIIYKLVSLEISNTYRSNGPPYKLCTTCVRPRCTCTYRCSVHPTLHDRVKPILSATFQGFHIFFIFNQILNSTRRVNNIRLVWHTKNNSSALIENIRPKTRLIYNILYYLLAGVSSLSPPSLNISLSSVPRTN